MRKIILIVHLFFFGKINAQDSVQVLNDTLHLKEVNVSSYPLPHENFTHTSSIETIDRSELQSQPGESVLFSVNRLPGIRMEERSPSSYRFSIRGSLLRSPFGVRNVKFYIDDFPLTDGSGNTYFNVIDKNVYQQIEIIKGPDGSFFGANTGGAVLLKSVQNIRDSLYVNLNLEYGSFNSFNKSVGVGIDKGIHTGSMIISHFGSDGYRKNSATERFNFITNNKFRYSAKNSVSLFIFSGTLDYRTPGGLTALQVENDPRMARPAGIFKSAEDQKAGIKNETSIAGISHDWTIGSNLNNKTLFNYSDTKFSNPFITNYEERTENTFSLRNITGSRLGGVNKIEWTAGIELQQTEAEIYNYGNRLGEKDTIQSSDEITYRQGFLFAGLSIHLTDRLVTEISASGNLTSVKFNSRINGSNGEIDFDFNVMPRFAALYSLSENINLRATASRGYSVPTIAEIHPSSEVISAFLQPEEGWNFEAGVRTRTNDNRLSVNVSAFYFMLNDAIVRRVDENENDFFQNSGGTLQPGIEAALAAEIIPLRTNGFFRFIQLYSSFSYNHFTFREYKIDENNFSGNRLTGVPDNTLTNQLRFDFPSNVILYLNSYYTSKTPLNDANTFYDDAFNLIEARLEKRIMLKSGVLKVGGGVKNLTDESYSLGNDLNAAGNRFFNPAPERNFFVSISFLIGSPCQVREMK